MTNSNRRAQRAAFFDLPSCTQRAIEHSLTQQLEERTLQRAQRKLAHQRKQVRQ